jgi:outer membrane immunogenic protein
MRSSSCLLAATAALVLSATVASAADIAPAPVNDWTGLYFGLSGGIGIAGSSDISETSDTDYWNSPSGHTPLDSQTNFIGGGQIGINYQIESFVLGAEGDLSYMNYDVSGTERDSSGILAGGDTKGSKQSDYLGTARLRAGFLVSPSILIYGTGGLAFANLEYGVNDACNTGSCGGGLTKGSTNVDLGWTVGGGIEYAIVDNWSVKAEYLYAQFPSEDFDTTSAKGEKSPWKADDTSFNVLRVGINYRL